MRRLSGRGARLAVLAVVLLLAGCVRLPDEGPVVTRDADSQGSVRQAFDIEARAPEPGASRVQVVTGFLDAMTAWPIQTSVAREYLSKDAGDEWNPEAATIVYADSRPAREIGNDVVVTLTGADRLDSAGTWRGEIPRAGRTLRFPITVEDGEFRISDPPDALIVPAGWFQPRFNQVSLYYFDPSAQILVPEPVFLPAGDQLATTLVTALLEGPPPQLRDVVRTFLPPDVSVGLSVPVSEGGVAEVDLVGDATQPSGEQAELLVAQLAWTLRQDPEITAFRVRVGGQEIRQADGSSLFPVSAGARFDPNGANSSRLLYGIRGGRMVRGEPGSLEPVEGPLGSARYQLGSFAVAPDAQRAAGITDDGRTAVVAPLRLGEDGVAADVVLSGATDLGRPTWDTSGHLWLLDRQAGGAVVWSVRNGTARQVRIPGITGAPARRLLVSRDGTRLLAVVRGPDGDSVVGARIVMGPRGGVAGSTAGFTVHRGRGNEQIVDIAWSTRTRIAVLSPARPGSLFEVDIVPVDGSSVGADTLSTVITGRVLGLAGPGTEGSPTYAVLRDSVVDVRTRETVALGGPVSALGYVG